MVALLIRGGHIQTSAHVLLAGGLTRLAGWGHGQRSSLMPAWALTTPALADTGPSPHGRPSEWRSAGQRPTCRRRWVAAWTHAAGQRALALWIMGAALGLALAAVQILPLGGYLAKSPVWGARQRERPSWWVVARPRVLDAVCTAAPYAFGSQRRGHPNLARALGVHNLNESAGGFAGLATLIWLAPLAVVTRGRSPHVRFLTALVVFGAMGAFRLPPVDNLLRLVPVLRRHRQPQAHALGRLRLDAAGRHRARSAVAIAPSGAQPGSFCWVAGGMPVRDVGARNPVFRAAASTSGPSPIIATPPVRRPGADPAAYQQRAERQVRQAFAFLPRYHALVGRRAACCWLASPSGVRRSAMRRPGCSPALLRADLAELGVLGVGSQPGDRSRASRYEPPVIARLRRELRSGGARSGWARNCRPMSSCASAWPTCAITIRSSWRGAWWFAPLYETDARRRFEPRGITWESVLGAASGLMRIRRGRGRGGACLLPQTAFDRVERVGQVWIACIDGKPWADSESPGTRLDVERDDGWARISWFDPAGRSARGPGDLGPGMAGRSMEGTRSKFRRKMAFS